MNQPPITDQSSIVNQPPIVNQSPINQEEEIKSIEDNYDYRQTYLKSLLNSVTKESIKEVW